MEFTVKISLHEAFVNTAEDVSNILTDIGDTVRNLSVWTDERYPIMDNGVKVGDWGFEGTGRPVYRTHSDVKKT